MARCPARGGARRAAGGGAPLVRLAHPIPPRRSGSGMLRSCMEDPMPITRGLALPLSEVDVRTSRSSGPGGQHANVTASRVEAVLDVAATSALNEEQRRRVLARCGPRIVAVAQDTRSQARNRELALERLRSRLAAALLVQRKRRATRPSRAAKERRLDAKRRTGERKQARRRPRSDDA